MENSDCRGAVPNKSYQLHIAYLIKKESNKSLEVNVTSLNNCFSVTPVLLLDQETISFPIILLYSLILEIPFFCKFKPSG